MLPRAPGLLGPSNFERWQQLGRAVRELLSRPGFERGLATDVGQWTAAEQSAWLDAALAMAARSQRAAVAVYQEAPTAVRALSSTLRGLLFDILKIAAEHADPGELAALMPVLGALVLDVPPGARTDALRLALSVTEAFPAAAPGLLRSLARITEEAPGERARQWAARGLELAGANPDAARAYFALESRTSIRVLRSSDTAASLEDVEGILHRYIQMLSGAPVFVRPGGSFHLRPPLEEMPAAGCVMLPATIDVLDTWEDNARLYRVLAAFLAARREFGTYAAADLVTYLRGKDCSPALEGCFLLADGYRVARRLAMTYAGLAAELAWATKALLARWQDLAPGITLLLDTLLAHAVASTQGPLPAWVAGIGAVALPCLAPLARPKATAHDALLIAELLAALLSSPEAYEAAGTGLPSSAEPPIAAGAAGARSGTLSTEDAAGGASHSLEAGEELPPELPADLQVRLGEVAERMTQAGRALSAEELARLAESGVILRLAPGTETTATQAGLYVTQLLGKILGAKPAAQPGGAGGGRSPHVRKLSESGPVFVYDEWDHVIADYRPGWCYLREVDLEDDAGLFFTRTLEQYAPLVPEIRRHFQRVRPESWRTIRSLEDGEDFDLSAVIDSRAERRAGRSPSPKLYTARARREREVATLFLLDMSASTDEAANVEGARRRIIDIEKEALVIMAAALEEIGDAYAIYGFSGQGRHNVEFYPIKAFTERLGAGAKGRIGSIQPRSSTRMGTPLRHCVRKMGDVRAQARYLILLSDGFPQDLDYGEDRRSYAYGINDTAVALREVESACIKPFCITVDLAGHDYLREMCNPQRYMLIENVGDLPRELPKIYQRLVRAM